MKLFVVEITSSLLQREKEAKRLEDNWVVVVSRGVAFGPKSNKVANKFLESLLLINSSQIFFGNNLFWVPL